jgi:hypothetical protein
MKKRPPAENGGQGVDKSVKLNDSAAFGLPLFYDRRLPDHNGQGYNGAEDTITSDNDAILHRT